MPLAVVLGVNGQDGGFLATHLLSRGYDVVGVAKQNTSRYVEADPRYAYEQLDLRNATKLKTLLCRNRPDVVFHVAAVHGSAGTTYESVWQDMVAVNLASVHIVLEYLRTDKQSGSFVYANSGKIFGPDYPEKVTEKSKARGLCLYTITKIAARDLIAYYRRRHGIKGSSMFLFNHESELRTEQFFIPKILGILAKSLKNPAYQDSVETLEFFCDWGSAEEYMDIAIDISEKAAGEDFVIGTGKTWHARLFIEHLFDLFGLNYRHHITEQKNLVSPIPTAASYRIDITTLHALVKRAPQITIFQVCDDVLKYVHGLNPEQYKVH